MTMQERLRIHDEIEKANRKHMEEAKMKEIKGYFRKATKYGSVWILRINDEDAMRSINLNSMTGWSVEHAKHLFNERLALTGYRIAETERDILEDGYSC